jgi:hypothetical protein
MTGGAMSQQENACCKSMHGDCGEMAKTGCCKTMVRTDAQPQIASAIISPNIHWAVINWFTPDFTVAGVIQSFTYSVPSDHSPPGLLVTQTTVLRI